MKVLPLYLQFIICISVCYCRLHEAVQRLIDADHIGCYSTINFQMPFGKSHNFNDNEALEETCAFDDSCCNLVVFADSPSSNGSKSLSQFRKYIIVTENPTIQQLSYNPVNVELIITFNENAYLFNKLGKYGWLLKKVWNGSEWMNKSEKSIFEGLPMRVATFMLPPFTDIWTLPDGTQLIGQGLDMSFMQEIAAHDNLDIQWIDVLHETGELWGSVLPDGSSSGQVKILYQFEADVGIGEILCGFKFDYLNRLSCSWTYHFDGLLTLIQKPKSQRNYLGIVTPYTTVVWGCVCVTLLVATLVIMFEQFTSTGGFDIMVNFLDAFNPMAGRPMSKPGFQAKRIKK